MTDDPPTLITGDDTDFQRKTDAVTEDLIKSLIPVVAGKDIALLEQTTRLAVDMLRRAAISGTLNELFDLLWEDAADEELSGDTALENQLAGEREAETEETLVARQVMELAALTPPGSPARQIIEAVIADVIGATLPTTSLTKTSDAVDTMYDANKPCAQTHSLDSLEADEREH